MTTSVRLRHYDVSLVLHTEDGEESNEANVLDWLLARLRAAPTYDELLDPTARAAVASLVSGLRGADVMSFTNHERMHRNDQVLTCHTGQKGGRYEADDSDGAAMTGVFVGANAWQFG